MRSPHSVSSAIAIVLVALAVAAGCSDDDETSQPTTTTATPAAAGGASTSSTDPSSTGETSSSTAPATGCTEAGPAMPGGAGSGEVVDLDGDRRPDTAWLAGRPDGTRQMGVTTAAGGGDAVEVRSASPVGLVLLAVDADQRPPVELLVSDNRSVQLWAFADCRLQPVVGPDGMPYVFDLGMRGTGTGVGCRDADDGRRLVGLNVTRDEGDRVDWSRTEIELDGLQASHGPTDTGTFRRPGDDGAIDLLHTVSCGDLTIAADGIRQPEP